MSGTSRPEMMVIRLLGDVGGVRVGGPTTSINPAEKSIPTIYMEKAALTIDNDGQATTVTQDPHQ